ncbi:MAG: glycosyltransferase [Pirellulales bacterium]|nr:glycosyltransferase [Pirellulales bacterium]
MKKRILQIVPTLDWAGTEKQMSLLVRRLPRDQFDVCVCALSQGGPLAAELASAGVEVATFGRRWPLDPRAVWQLQRHVARWRPDLIHCWLSAANAYGLAVARACRVKCLVAALRNIEPPKGWIELATDRYVGRRCSRLVVNSGAVREYYVRRGLPAGKIRVIPNGVGSNGQSDTTRRQLLAELGLPAPSRLVGVVGRLSRQKRIKDAIWAADLLKVIRDDVHLLIIGDGPHRQRLQTFRKQVVIRDKVHFLGDRGDVSQWMPHFDVLWSTGGAEGQSNAVMEAMAASVPVVATDVPGARELVVPEQTGYLVALGDRAGIARHTNRLLEDGELAERLGRAGRERVEREFHSRKMVEQYVSLYRESLE